MARWAVRAGGVLVVISALLGTLVYLNRESLIDRAIRSRLAEASTPGFVNDPAGFRVMLCGTGSPEPSAAKTQACTLVNVGGKIFVFDVGDGATKSLTDHGVSIIDIDRVFITHLHSDHFNGLGTLNNQSWTWGRTTPLEVTGPVGTAEMVDAINRTYRIDNGFRTANMPELDAARTAAAAHPTEIRFPGAATSVRVYDEGGVTIDARLVEHDPVRPALGYVIQYAGKKLFISGDTEVADQNQSAMQDADLVVHEAYATHLVRRAIPVMRELGMTHDAEVAERTIPYHADTLALAEQAQRAGVKHLALTHLTPYPDGFVARRLFVREMSDRYSGEITVGEDGMVIPV